MLVSEPPKPIIAVGKTVPDTRSRVATGHHILIPGSPISFADTIDETVTLVKSQNKLSSSKIFSISFSYSGQVYQTKVLKVTYSSNQSLYKVALSSKIADHSSICWLQYQTQGWDLLLGHELDERLKQAITLAIGCREF